jgi:hypothetical protein
MEAHAVVYLTSVLDEGKGKVPKGAQHTRASRPLGGQVRAIRDIRLRSRTFQRFSCNLGLGEERARRWNHDAVEDENSSQEPAGAMLAHEYPSLSESFIPTSTRSTKGGR